MISRLIPILAAAFLTAPAQVPVPDETWTVEYDRVRRGMHGEPSTVREKAHLTIRRVKDSVSGTLLVVEPDSAPISHLLRGLSRGDTIVFQLDGARRQGFAAVLSAVEVAMDWLKQTVHGVEPELVEFRVRIRGDSLAGTRAVSGGGRRPAEPARVAGRRR